MFREPKSGPESRPVANQAVRGVAARITAPGAAVQQRGAGAAAAASRERAADPRTGHNMPQG